MILNTIFSFALFVSGGHVMDTKLSLHHYSDEDYKEIFYLKNKKSIFKECIRHSEFEDVKKIRRHRPDGGQETLYLIVPISSIISYIK
jgi:hypothetical protein|tara:strand:- start:114 stop:377 length:264 start_codon:yes stop_codon:yes gene_type:complete